MQHAMEFPDETTNFEKQIDEVSHSADSTQISPEIKK